MENNSIQHFGVRGMRWGVQRTAEQLSGRKATLDNSGKIIGEANKINTAIAGIRTASRNKEASELSDQELQEKIKRMTLEQNYATLSSNRKVAGQNYIKSTLEFAGSVLAIGSSATAIMLTIKGLKG